MERAQDLPKKERVAGGLARQKLGERRDPRGCGAQRVAQEVLDGPLGERQQIEARRGHPLSPEGGLEPGERMAGAHVSRPEGADQEHVFGVRIRGERVHGIEARGVRPVQVVQEDHDGPPGRGEDLQEGAQDDVEAGLRLPWLQRRERRKRAQQVAELGQELGEGPPVVAHRLQDPGPVVVARLLRRFPQLAHEVAQRLDQGRERRVGRALIELPGDEAGPGLRRASGRARDLLANGHDEGALAHAGVSPDEDQLSRSLAGARDRSAEGGELVFAPVESFGHRKLEGQVEAAELERLD